MKLPSPILPLLAALSAATLGCQNAPSTCADVPELPEPDTTAPISRWVIDSVDMPNTADDAIRFGCSLELDDDPRSDNALGQVLSTVYGQLGSDLEGIADEMVASGQLLHLIELQSASLADADGVSVRLFVGADTDGDPSDNFSGSERFEIEPGHPARPMLGAIAGGKLHVDRGILPLGVALPGADEPTYLEVTASRIEAEVTGDRITGKLCGALTVAQVNEQLIPFIHSSLENSVSIDCDEDGCVPDSQGELFLELFDADMDREITLEEVRENSIVESLLAPDVDLYDEEAPVDGSREYGPGCDQVKDALSLGVGFTAVRADFASP